MIPKLFDKMATSFTTEGIGRLTDCLSCEVAEERNGVFDLEMVYLAGGQWYDQIELGSLIVVKPYEDGTPQAFRVYEITKPINRRVTIYAHHISYDMNYIPVQPFSATGIQNALSGITSNATEACPFTLTTTITNEETAYILTLPRSMRACLGGMDNSILDVFSGSGGIEYQWDNYTVNVLRNRGADNGVQLRYGKNITGFELKDDGADIITGVVPYWTDQDNSVVLVGATQYNAYASLYPFKRVIPLDLSSQFENTPEPAQLNTAGYQYVNAEGQGLPKTSIKVNFISLSSASNYSSYAYLEKVKLCDTVRVIIDELGISYTAKVVKCVWDVLKDRYTEIEIGNPSSSLGKTLAAQVSNLESVINMQDKIVSFTQTMDAENGEFQRTISERYNNLNTQVNGNGGIASRTTALEQNAGKISLSAKTEVLNDVKSQITNDMQTQINTNKNAVQKLETTLSVESSGVYINQGTEGNYLKLVSGGMEIYVDNVLQAKATKDGFNASNFMTGDWHIEPYENGVLNFYKK